MYGLIDDDAPDFKPCERTVRMCIEALSKDGANGPANWITTSDGAQVYVGEITKLGVNITLLGLIQKRDPAKVLVEAWYASGPLRQMVCKESGGYAEIADYEAFTRWLIDTGRIRSGE